MKIEAISQVNDTEGPDGKPLISVPWLLLHCLGFGACWAWVHVCFFSSVLLGGSGQTGIASWLANLLSNAVAMVGLGMLGGRLGPLGSIRATTWAAATAVCLGTLVTALLREVAPVGVWFACGPVVTGVGTAALLLLWAESYQSIDAFWTKKYTLPGAMTAGVLIYLLVVSLSGAMGIVVAALLPFLSVLCLKSTFKPDGEGAQRSIEGTGKGGWCGWPEVVRGGLLRFILIIAIYCLPSGFMSGRSTILSDEGGEPLGMVMFGGIAILLVVVTVLSIVLIKPTSGDFVYRMIVPLMAAGLLLMPFVDGVARGVADMAIMGGYIILEMFAWSVLSDISRTTRAPAAVVFGIGKSGMNIGLLAGCLLGLYASSQSTVIMLGMSVVIVYVFILLGALSPGKRQAALVPPIHGICEEDSAGDLASTPSLDEMRGAACRALAEAYGLSRREEEVLRLLSAGRSLEVIGGKLGISQSTVRSHRDHIYRKLGIHDRQELLDLMDGQAYDDAL